MFENIDKILAQLSVKQKITGLAMMLITTAIIVLGGYYFKSSTDLKVQVDSQTNIIKNQQQMIDTLTKVANGKSKDIIKGLQDCENNSIQREIEYAKQNAELRKTFYDELENIKKYAIRKNRMAQVSGIRMESINYDTLMTSSAKPKIVRSVAPDIIPEDGFDNIIGLIEKTQKKIKK